MVGVADELPSALGRQSVNGPTLMEVANPSDPNGTVLLVTGRDRDEVITASKGIGFGSSTLPTASRMDVAPIDVGARVANDAPSFIPTNRPVRLGELVPDSSCRLKATPRRADGAVPCLTRSVRGAIGRTAEHPFPLTAGADRGCVALVAQRGY